MFGSMRQRYAPGFDYRGAVRTLGQPNASFKGDRGEPDAALRALLAAAYTTNDAYLHAVAGLCAGRLLLPIVAAGEDHGDGPDPDRHAELAAVLLESGAGDGRRGVVVFTGLDALQAWNPQARPVPCTLDDVAATAVETQASAILIDPGLPHSFVLEDDLIAQLSQGRRLVALDDGGFGWLYVAPDEART